MNHVIIPYFDVSTAAFGKLSRQPTYVVAVGRTSARNSTVGEATACLGQSALNPPLPHCKQHAKLTCGPRPQDSSEKRLTLRQIKSHISQQPPTETHSSFSESQQRLHTRHQQQQQPTPNQHAIGPRGGNSNESHRPSTSTPTTIPPNGRLVSTLAVLLSPLGSVCLNLLARY